ncbi:MAG: radical SAM protein [Clostridia bacterium]|nr:radical SAM protein [Clostridia bacterium]
MNPYMNLNRLEFILTDHCTGRCRHCSAGALVQHPRPGHVPLEESVQAVRDLAAMYPMQSVMTFGGEPLLYPEVTAEIHRAAAECGIPARQLITNGFFSRDDGRIREVADMLADAGVNDVLISVDAFHQERIPLEPVRAFALAVKAAGIANVRFSPAWVVKEDFSCLENARTREILADLADTGLPVGSGNDIFLSGCAAENLAHYYPAASLDMADRCGSMPYTEPLTNQTSVSIEPDGSVTLCGFAIGNVKQECMADIIARYDPFAHEGMRAAMDGVPGLLALAERRGVSVDLSRCYSVCDLCRRVNKA